MSNVGPTFTKKETIDKPGIVGARWWQESIATEVPRRKAIMTFVALGGVLAAVGGVGLLIAKGSKPSSGGSSGGGLFSSSSTPEYEFQPRTSLDMQKEFGWNFGALGEALVFDGMSTQPFDRTSLDSLATDLAPASAVYTPFWIPTLFQSPSAMPKSVATGDVEAPAFQPLKEVIVPIKTPAMDAAFGRGKALAAVLSSNPAKTKDLAVIVDLAGPEAVAFAAGMAGKYDPVFLFDNWPHPQAVVKAHLTLAAAIYYQPLFAKAKAGAKLPPVFVLDRTRLATYVDDATQFDNRYTAKMPTPAGLKTMGVAKLLYVGPNAIDRFELDDLVDDFVGYATAGAQFRVCPTMAFEAPVGADVYYYGGAPATTGTFWTHWDQPAQRTPNEVQSYAPKPRATAYSSPTAVTPGQPHPRPTGFGMVPVAIAVGTGVVLGARASRSGSWNRTTSTSTSS